VVDARVVVVVEIPVVLDVSASPPLVNSEQAPAIRARASRRTVFFTG
jgi:hypothetical protein